MTIDKKELRDAQEGPTVEELKERFKAGSIPLQTDFADLIDVADHGRKAVGKAAGQAGPANGFTLSSMGRLELNLNTEGALKADANGIAVKAGKGIKVDKSGVAVKTGKGITVNANGELALTLAKGANANGGGGEGNDGQTTGSAGGLTLSDKGISVDAGDGIQINGRGVSIKLTDQSGLSAGVDGALKVVANTAAGLVVDKNGVGVKLYPDWGLEHNDSGISVKTNGKKGIAVDKDGIGVNLNAEGALKADANGIAVKAGKGIKVDKSGVAVKTGKGITVNANGELALTLAKGANANGGGGEGNDGQTTGSAGGLTLSDKGISVDAGDGIQINGRGVSIKLTDQSGLSAGVDGALKVVANTAAGLVVDKNGVGVKLYPDCGMEHNDSGISVKVNKDKGLEVDKDGIGLKPEQSFQKGMVMMFAGTAAEMPKGWALCDGKDGRPDLRDRFVLGAAEFSDVNKTNNQKVTGGNEDKQCSVKSNAQTPNISVTVNEHALSLAQIPAHSHLGGMRSSNYHQGAISNHVVSKTAEYGSVSTNKSPNEGYPLASIEVFKDGHSISAVQLYTSTEGDSKPHQHDASATQDAHQHNINVVPPYYILAFIIKL